RRPRPGSGPPRGATERREIVVAEEEPKQVEQVRRPVVNRRGSDQQNASSYDQLRDGAVPVGVGIPEAVGFVHDDKAAEGGTSRQWAARGRAKRFVGDDRGADTVLREQGTPLVNQDGWDHESEGFTEREGDRERDVRLAQAHGVGEQRTTGALNRWHPPRAGSARRRASAVGPRESKRPAGASVTTRVRARIPYPVFKGSSLA